MKSLETKVHIAIITRESLSLEIKVHIAIITRDSLSLEIKVHIAIITRDSLITTKLRCLVAKVWKLMACKRVCKARLFRVIFARNTPPSLIE